MTKRRILVTGATGKTGSVVASELLNRGHPVRALVHREDVRSAALRARGAQVVAADLSDVERVADAMRDVQGAYFCPPIDPYMIQGAVAFAVAAKDAHVEHMVGVTQWLSSPSHPSLMTRQHWLSDKLFAMTPGVAHTTVNPGFFADNYLLLTAIAANLGVYPWILGEGRNAPPSNEDIARVAAAALMDPSTHAGKTYRPTGPELLGPADIVAAIGRAVGRSVTMLPTPGWLFMKSARLAGFPIELLNNLRYYVEDYKQGAFELGAPTSDVLEVTGKAPEDFETIARRSAALPENQRTFGNWFDRFAQFLVAPLYPAFNFERFDQQLRSPSPSIAQFASESRVWKREHNLWAPADDESLSSVTPTLKRIAVR